MAHVMTERGTAANLSERNIVVTPISDTLYEIARECRETGNSDMCAQLVDCAETVRRMEEFCDGVASSAQVVRLRPALAVLQGGRL
jgi:hypothetical protein